MLLIEAKDYNDMSRKAANIISAQVIMNLFDPENPGNEDTEKGYIYYLRDKELRIFQKKH